MREEWKLEKVKSCQIFSELIKLKLMKDGDHLYLDEHVDEMKFRVKVFYT